MSLKWRVLRDIDPLPPQLAHLLYIPLSDPPAHQLRFRAQHSAHVRTLQTWVAATLVASIENASWAFDIAGQLAIDFVERRETAYEAICRGKATEVSLV